MKNFQILFALIFASGTFALYEGDPNVVTLTPESFEELVASSDDVWIVKYYAQWCGWSVRAVPEYSRSACALKGTVKVGAIDADRYRAFGQQQGIVAYPTFRVITGDTQVDYQGPRTADTFVDAALQLAYNKAHNKLDSGACGPPSLMDTLKSTSSEKLESNVCAVK